MSVFKVVDTKGRFFTTIEKDGCRFPNKNLRSVQNFTNFKLRKDDVLICAYMKSGTHWLWEICRMLVAGTTEVKIVEKESQMIELANHDDLDKDPSPRFINTHARFDLLPNDFWKFRNKIIYIRRNPKAVAVSFYNHTKTVYEYDGEWNDFFKLFVDGVVDNGSWFEYVLQWERIIKHSTEDRILDIAYEDVKEDPLREIRRICEFLEITTSEDLMKDIIDHCDFKKLKKRKENFSITKDGNLSLYRKGWFPDWKNWFTVAQNEYFDEVYKRRMIGSKLQFKYQ
ncbi:hypothetical protein LOTGIDRAFT_139283 [Lottia gigantea]|uniref:Sulfotransferase domain-containing protein n=1 Tax=Lottia gigantea TaxID=225164 RepID=V4B6H2_LOTGI|nr:hypothetical protein LOTGIDRAFT_139283 [Lottia gigantea]ESP01667.1 hypothetical protein LOTGIDRAFT_139283 [Lottia gigantea]